MTNGRGPRAVSDRRSRPRLVQSRRSDRHRDWRSSGGPGRVRHLLPHLKRSMSSGCGARARLVTTASTTWVSTELRCSVADGASSTSTGRDQGVVRRVDDEARHAQAATAASFATPDYSTVVHRIVEPDRTRRRSRLSIGVCLNVVRSLRRARRNPCRWSDRWFERHLRDLLGRQATTGRRSTVSTAVRIWPSSSTESRLTDRPGHS